MSRGQLYMTIGEEETERTIAAGHYQSYLDSDGEEMFVKKDKELSFTKQKMKEVKTQRHPKLPPNLVT